MRLWIFSRVAFLEALISILFVLRSGLGPGSGSPGSFAAWALCRGPVCPNELLRRGCADARRILVRWAPGSSRVGARRHASSEKSYLAPVFHPSKPNTGLPGTPVNLGRCASVRRILNFLT